MKLPPILLLLTKSLMTVMLPCGTAYGIDLSTDELQTLQSQVEFNISGGCAAEDSLAEKSSAHSYYLFDKTGTLRHFLQNSRGELRLARQANLDAPISDCVVVEQALVFVKGNDGVFQIDRRIDASLEPIWLSPVPEEISLLVKFERQGEELYLQTIDGRERVVIDTPVRNEQVRTVHPDFELPLLRQDNSLLASTDHGVDLGGHYYEVVANDEPRVALYRQDDGIKIERDGESLKFGLQGEIVGACVDQVQFMVLQSDGLVRRFQLDGNSVTEQGQYQLASDVSRCTLTDDRAYVVGSEPVIWVFNLNDTGLGIPRTVTSNRMLQGINGIASYQHESLGFVIVQSTSDSAFLVFEADTMQLVDRFVIGVETERFLDGVLESQGFAIYKSKDFPFGQLVVHDVRNRFTSSQQNLKVVDWLRIRQSVAGPGD